jgi:hypothetical protein
MLHNLLSKCTGLNNLIDPTRLQHDPNSGVSELSEAVNVYVDDSGAVSRRPGQSLLSAGEFHSLYCNKGDCFVVQDRTDDAAIYKVGTDFSLSGVRSGLVKGARVSYWQEGAKTYYSSEFHNGVIENGISASWPTNVHVGADTTRVFSVAPKGTHLGVFQGRMWLAAENVIWVSEPYAFGKFDMARCFFQFGSRVRMIKPVLTGVWISTDEYTGFIKGADKFEQMSFEKKSSLPAHEYSECIELSENVATQLNLRGQVATWSSDAGLCVGTEDGKLLVPTENKLLYPAGSMGATVALNNEIINVIY